MPSDEVNFIPRDGKTIAWDHGHVTARSVSLCRAPKRMVRQKKSSFCTTLNPSRAILIWDQNAPLFAAVNAILVNHEHTKKVREENNRRKKVVDAMARLQRMKAQQDLLRASGEYRRLPRPRLSKYAKLLPGYQELYDELHRVADELESREQAPKTIDEELFAPDLEEQKDQPDPGDNSPTMPVHRTPPVALPAPMQAALGVVRYGKKFPPGTNDLTIELYAFRNRLTSDQGGLGPFQHFKNAVDLLWNRKGSTRRFIWSPWAEEMIREACDNQYLSVAGCASCVSGSTKMLDPITGEAPTIKELCDAQIRPTVMTLNGPVLADVPFHKGRAPLYRFRLSSGESFDCTEEHRLLTPSGWTFARNAIVGSLLYGYVPSLPHSTSGSGHGVRTPDAPRCSRTVEGSQSRCSVYLHPDDELLHRAREAAQARQPLDERCSFSEIDSGSVDFAPHVTEGQSQSSYALKVALVAVESIEYLGEHDFYDLNVPREHHYFAHGGIHHNSGKSDTYALWAIVNYIAAPTETLVILTSTTLREARRRVWKSVEDMWLSAPGLPGKLVSSLGQIKGMQKQGDFWEGTGLVLIPSEKKAEREAVGKLVGIKAPRVILIADELPELPESIVNAAYSNLSKNPYFQMVGLGNPNSFFDAFGMFSEPKAGWGSITEDDFSWETSRGKCIRFDAELCPNVIEGKIIYPWMPTREKIDQDREHYGPRSLAYYRMVRGFWAPEGASTGIYSEADLVRGVASRKGKFKDGTATRVAGLDPSFSAGGDRTIAFFGTVGTCAETDLPIIQFDEYVALKEDISDKNNPRSHQLAIQFVQECNKRNVSPRNAGVDSTGGGSVFCDVLATVWGTDAFVRVGFGGAASHKAVSATDKTLAKDRYANRMSEIWYIGQELLRSGQIRNVTPELAREMVSRQYETKKQGSMKIKVESKTEYKARTGKSPDIADAAFVMVDVARTRFGLVGNERFEINQTRQNTFRSRMMALDAVNPSVTLRF